MGLLSRLRKVLADRKAKPALEDNGSLIEKVLTQEALDVAKEKTEFGIDFIKRSVAGMDGARLKACREDVVKHFMH